MEHQHQQGQGPAHALMEYQGQGNVGEEVAQKQEKYLVLPVRMQSLYRLQQQLLGQQSLILEEKAQYVIQYS